MKHPHLLLLLGGLLLATAARSADPVRYVDAATLTVIGKALPTEQPYNRIDTTRFRVPAKTPGYCYHPTGLAVVFRTDSRTIRARWETSGKNPSDNMAAVAQKGLDLYIRSNGEWVFAGVGRPKINGSLMLKIAGISTRIPTVLICLDLLVAARTARPSVAPLPPMVMKVHQNGSFTMYGRDTAAVPAANAAMFAL